MKTREWASLGLWSSEHGKMSENSSAKNMNRFENITCSKDMTQNDMYSACLGYPMGFNSLGIN